MNRIALRFPRPQVNKSLISLLLILLLGCCIMCGVMLLRPSFEEYGLLSWSPDGRRLIFECTFYNPAENDIGKLSFEDICIISSDGYDLVRLTNDPEPEYNPTWSPDGLQIAYTRHDGIYVINADGSNQEIVWENDDKYQYVAVSDDGQIAFSTYGAMRHTTTLLEYIPQTNKWQVAQKLPGLYSSMAWAPNGKYLAFNSGNVLNVETGEIHRFPIPEPGYSYDHFWRDGPPSWSPNSQQIANVAQSTAVETFGSFNINHGFLEVPLAEKIYISNLQDGTVKSLRR